MMNPVLLTKTEQTMKSKKTFGMIIKEKVTNVRRGKALC